MFNTAITQAEKAKALHSLHHSGKLLLLPNVWDVLGARLLEDTGYKVIATASAAVAYSNGYNDGEQIPFTDVLRILTAIAGSVHVPVTADIESGYAEDENQLEHNIRQLIKTGIAGINIEDTDKKAHTLLQADVQCRRIKLIKEIALDMDVPLFINARTDTFIHAQSFHSSQQMIDETVKRGGAYKDAGADCFYPILIHEQAHIKTVVDELKMPINILMIPGIPGLQTLEQMGVARVSLGPGYLKYALKAMKDIAFKLLSFEGVEEITGNDITSDYLKHLVTVR
ncbi:isocitrate lyase/PEP mutase family protein [Parafilimonas terrae]|uniref:2-Methylisocitrate lyase, PEP mutase family n=1 Tax=Parafilimonas terrae TaxID=1465490 RepID=A0A1I5YI03_9BACT|nr:isocitrate lyase/phosphoenolpyruvate mutase family protein [Parafilimonas terrae]SFQ43790.1 2-Methylisocitrate lyase, PEP mutase family [Parafilimonas terrae]